MLILLSDCEEKIEKDIEVEDEIVNEMNLKGIPSVVACIVKDGSIVWEKTFGFADVQEKIPAFRETIYSMMSVSKLVLSIAVWQLWERDLIDLHADINTYLPFNVRNPNYPEENIMPHMLLNHTSGLAWPEEEDHIPDFWHFYQDAEVPSIGDWIPEYIIEGGSQYRDNIWKDFKPGTRELYSNIGTSLLALIVEEIVNEDFRDYCSENILIPLEMYNSGYRLKNYNRASLATPYYDNNQPFEPYILRHYPTGSLNSNIVDFSHFAFAILNKGTYNGRQILKPGTVDKMFEVQNPESGLSNLWWHYQSDGIGHNGGGTGYSTMFELFPGQQKGLIILSNKKNTSVYPEGMIYDLVRYQCALY
jgi:CubicO group peptidase (beta-lactamase class C family)